MNDRVVKEPHTLSEVPADTIKHWLARELARVLNISREAIATNEPCSRFELDSVKAVRVLGRLGEFLNRKIPLTLIWSDPTIKKLSNCLSGNSELDPPESPTRPVLASVCNQPIAVIDVACRYPGGQTRTAFGNCSRPDVLPSARLRPTAGTSTPGIMRTEASPAE